ncbi:septum formation inhibitor Maf [Geobacter sulfurreducens]|uniref:dTTP/UTP pyrophosphatase n=1 Tax=Geobacter sulfurreducens (strain ATCC 51573 / DSM 12127 / PCA) TaxID=243231 RepID=NTPPA_GEOSL|nr:Maf family nucleotide pyrophosphatase [Geobacter sulfurreducens]Q74A46.1 RecName: Full=dTTP/UTP pyrophosphatase; Short=dTTPase/UTPase; AltName: Full=Nucleoside triphosphate pyrophosphatase; AltName: Full=Nucleotide pyrophosphatase; Short=Nucleotide PPase [Geobacter sulfurreducens PCA]AAR35918.1 nucleotide/nucleic acid-binding septum formation-inhibiting protein [Geobacter sulfurreducens PCA]ADI85303.1 nucleotide/nucleic acid-binding septum formation-inhibiting protein [Geobacter sulfurreducen
MEKGRIVLASASPRRLELLASAGVEFDVCASDIPEEPIPGEAPADFATRLARDKAVATAARTEGRWFVGADTIVVCAGEIMGKPVDEADAVRMLRKLSGVSHEVITGYAVYDRERDGLLCKAVVTKVVFKPLRDEEISAYVATGCPMDKAGAYAIQGGAAYMVERIDGSYTNVVGLPLCEVVEDLRRIGAL